MTIVLNGTTGITTPTTSSTGEFVTSVTGFKNRIINGAMVIDQRYAGAQNTTGLYTLDRWQSSSSQNSWYTCQQNAGSVTPPAGFSKYMGYTSTGSNSVGTSDYLLAQQGIEGFNIADLAWGTASAATVALSFWVRSSLTGTFSVVLRNAMGGTSNRTYAATYTISSANTWEQKTITIAGDTSGTWSTTNTCGISVNFGLGVGSSFVTSTTGSWQGANYLGVTGATSVVGTNGATFYITGVQLEKGSTATSFDYRPYGTELALCQRYYWRFDGGQGNGTYSFCSGSIYGATTTLRGYLKYPVTMRSGPTLSYAGTITGSGGSNDNTVSAIATQLTGLDSALVDFTVAAGTVGQGKIVYVPSAAYGTNYIQGSAEL